MFIGLERRVLNLNLIQRQNTQGTRLKPSNYIYIYIYIYIYMNIKLYPESLIEGLDQLRDFGGKMLVLLESFRHSGRFLQWAFDREMIAALTRLCG